VYITGFGLPAMSKELHETFFFAINGKGRRNFSKKTFSLISSAAAAGIDSRT
jgi:hypothetical protein